MTRASTLKRVTESLCAVVLLGLSSNVLLANNVNFQYEIKHPKLSLENPTPLVVKIIKSGSESSVEKIVSHPMVHLFYDSRGQIESKASWIRYQDAFKFPDGQGFVLVTRKFEYETHTHFEAIETYYQHHHGHIKKPTGEKLYWTADGKHFVTVCFPSVYGKERQGPVKLNYYTHGKLQKTETLSSKTEFYKLGLVKAE